MTIKHGLPVALVTVAVALVPGTSTAEAPIARDGGQEPGAGESCTKPERVQRLVFTASKYPNIRRHFRGALRRGWPRRLVVNRPGADARRDRLLEHYPTRDGHDRDEYPPAVGRGNGKGLERGRNPRGWRADVRYVPSSENRSHGATLGAMLQDFCDGTRFRYVFR
ncbi:MAG: NucA/NucB deoxyribonuclease domain-containing protein [Thermoleophilaceae bacterium]